MNGHSVGRLADRLASARGRHFVGRREEVQLFRSALLAGDPPVAVLHVHGPGGVGKTALLGEFSRLASDVGVRAWRVDGRNVEPSPRGFLLALGEALGLDEAVSPLDHLARQPRAVLLVDTLEVLAPLDTWLRESFIPQLPDGTLVVTAGRRPPDPAWRADPGWRDLVREVALRNLRAAEGQEYLSARGVSGDQHAGVLAFTHGHPFALALVADALAQGGPGAAFRPDGRPDVVRVLLERFLEHVPSPRHREALEVCAHARVTTEALLAEAIGRDDAPALFRWLRGLSLIEEGREGLLPHDLAREVLDADLRWRNPAAYQEVHRRVRRFVLARMQSSRGREQQRAAVDLMYLHRANPLMQRLQLVDWETLGTGYTEPAAPPDFATIRELVRRHEGEESARIADHWLRRQPGAFTIFRGAAGELTGFAASLRLDEATPEDAAADPAAAAALDFTRRGAGRSGERLLHHRFWMGRGEYQIVSPLLNLMAITSVSLWMGTPGLAWSVVAFAHADVWHETFAYMRFRRAPEADFAVGGHSYGVFVHDWLAEPVAEWLDRMGDRELATDLTLAEIEAPPPPALFVPTRPEFEAAVRQALRDFTRPAALAASPLLRSRSVAGRDGGAPTATTLRALLREAAGALRANPRDEKLYRALQRTYFDPAPTQELAAELLGLPFSTYRYHLNRGIARVADWLWRREGRDPGADAGA